MRNQSDVAFAVTIAVGFIWGYLTKAVREWGKREDERIKRQKEARERLTAWQRQRHPSWGETRD